MATTRQIEANRLNAQKSTGPRTDEGKAQSRANAVTHGLTSEDLGVQEPKAAAFLARREAWSGDAYEKGSEQDWALDRAVAASFQIERCERAYDGVLARLAERAGTAWDLDRRLEVGNVAARLAKDPMRVSRRLEATRHGCELMRELWLRLGEALEDDGDWTQSQRSTALDLLGLPPDLRGGLTPLDPFDDSDPATRRLEVVVEECRRLGELLTEVLEPLDDLERRHAQAGPMGIFSKPAQLVLRYERDAWRRYREANRDRKRPAPKAELNAPEPAPSPTLPRVPRYASAEEAAIASGRPLEPIAAMRRMDNLPSSVEDPSLFANRHEEHGPFPAGVSFANFSVGQARVARP